MKNPTLHLVRTTLIAAFAAVSSLAAAQANDASPADQGTRNYDSAPGTIQWGPPGAPQQEQSPSGAQGPVRTDTGLSSDPSIRDTDPLTANGPWEQLSGDRVVNPAVQQQQPQEQSQPQQQQ